MSGKIAGFLRNYVLFFSIVLTIVGSIVFFIGITGMFIKEIPMNWFNLSEDIIKWSIYFLIVGFIILVTGVWYLFTYLKNRRFINKELETNKRSEFIKRHSELVNTVKHMPSKYKEMLEEKEKELNIK